ncbi:hypothetical protein [Thiolapillus sp.]
MCINETRSARWLHTFAQIMEVDRQRPLGTRPAPNPSLPASSPLECDKKEDKS